MIFLLQSDSGIIDDIRHVEICRNAGFKLDKPMAVGNGGAYFELLRGQWFLVEWNEEGRLLHPVGGRWTTNN